MESIDMYAAYLEELGAKHLFRNDKGFVIYSFVDNNCYIEDIFILPQYRGKQEFNSLADSIIKIANQKECKKLLGSVIPSISASTRNVKIMLDYGFKIVSSANNFIVFEKEVK